jgi:hypothetical protein
MQRILTLAEITLKAACEQPQSPPKENSILLWKHFEAAE